MLCCYCIRSIAWWCYGICSRDAALIFALDAASICRKKQPTIVNASADSVGSVWDWLDRMVKWIQQRRAVCNVTKRVLPWLNDILEDHVSALEWHALFGHDMFLLEMTCVFSDMTWLCFKTTSFLKREMYSGQSGHESVGSAIVRSIPRGINWAEPTIKHFIRQWKTYWT